PGHPQAGAPASRGTGAHGRSDVCSALGGRAPATAAWRLDLESITGMRIERNAGREVDHRAVVSKQPLGAGGSVGAARGAWGARRPPTGDHRELDRFEKAHASEQTVAAAPETGA